MYFHLHLPLDSINW